MAQRPSYGFGQRLARYRKIAGLSAQQLSEAIGGEMSRGVIANIESGRKTDVTLDQVITLAWALKIPFVVLALPVEQPYKFVRVIEGKSTYESLRTFALMEWMSQGVDSLSVIGPSVTELGPAGIVARETIRGIREYELALRRFRKLQHETGNPKFHQSNLDEAEAEFIAAEKKVRELGVDPRVYEIDEA